MLLSNELTGINQILPHKYKWAWDLFLEGVNNTWVPTKILMNEDILQWKDPELLTDNERLVIKRCLGFFAGGESIVSNNIALIVYKYITSGEIRQYLIEQLKEEAIHNWTIVYICDSLNLNVSEVYEAYKNIPSIKAKDDFLMELTKGCAAENLDMTRKEDIQKLLRTIVTYYIFCEGMLFYSGFAMLLSFGRQNKMTGISEQIEYTLRDETLHVKFGVKLIDTIRREYSFAWTKEFEQEIIKNIEKCIELEVNYANDVLPKGVLGLNAEMFLDYMKYIGNRRLEQLRIDYKFSVSQNPFEWLAEQMDIPKLKNFFESHVIEYRTGGLIDDLE